MARKHLTIHLELTAHTDITNESILSEIRSHLDSVPGFYEAKIELDTFTAPVYYMILQETERETWYWSNEHGWVEDHTQGTRFDTKVGYNLPLDGFWQRFSGETD